MNDKGQLCGITITDEVLTNLGGLRSNGNIQLLPQINVAKFTLAGSDIAVVEVFPSHATPVRYQGNIWVRIGPRKSKGFRTRRAGIDREMGEQCSKFLCWLKRILPKPLRKRSPELFRKAGGGKINGFYFSRHYFPLCNGEVEVYASK